MDTDPLLLYPMILRIQTPLGLVDFDWSEPALDSVQAETVRASELKTLLNGMGRFAVAGQVTATRLRIQSGPPHHAVGRQHSDGQAVRGTYACTRQRQNRFFYDPPDQVRGNLSDAHRNG
ncbi:hypothetical protein [Deinococcus sp. QL22]|uniref:hypothetical protein n=1 Tax=Deinococcus sp. QL22 TaxID=2939437 RepID=UPI002016EDDA|nr:hypothetical protein [Deinococcus sp. QL22]UQN04871.1 hypothetical protein M1R55_08015 [Deinococcus sp. QL22]